MSDRISVKDLPEEGEFVDGGKLFLPKIVFGVIGGIGMLVTLALLAYGNGDSSSEEASVGLGDMASYSYLFAITFFLTLGMGGLFWTILHHATNSGWGITVRRQMENIAGLVPWVFVLMIPFWFSGVRDDLWEWGPKARALDAIAHEHLEQKLAQETEEWEHQLEASDMRVNALSLLTTGGKATPGELAVLKDRQDDIARRGVELEAEKPTEESVLEELRHDKDPLLAHKMDFFFSASKLRLALYTVIFIGIVWLLRAWSLGTDKSGGDKLFLRSRYWSCFFLLPFAVGLTFWAFDFLMGLDYKWFSTMWGVYIFAGSALASMALLVILVTWLRALGYLKQVVTMEHYHLMGKLMLSFCVFWAYIAFSQYFLIWYANITEETSYFLLRNTGFWNDLNVFLVVGHFFIPFVFLLWRPLKKQPILLSIVSAWILLMHALDIYLIVAPERGPSLSVAAGMEPRLWFGKGVLPDLIAFLGVGGVCGFILLHLLKCSSLYPCRDPRLEESVNVTN